MRSWPNRGARILFVDGDQLVLRVAVTSLMPVDAFIAAMSARGYGAILRIANGTGAILHFRGPHRRKPEILAIVGDSKVQALKTTL